MKDKKVLVTGGGGFLGKAIVKKLVQKKADVSAFSRASYKDLHQIGVTQIKGDLTDPRDVLKALEGIDIVYHVAAKTGFWGPYKAFYKANVAGTENILHGCNQHKVDQLIHTSSPSVVFDHSDKINIDERAPYPKKYLTAYSETKAIAERLVIKASQEELKSIIIRPHQIWGPGDNHIFPRIIKREHRLRKIGRKDTRVDTIYIDNAADAHILASEKLAENPALSGNIYFVSQDEPIHIWDMIDAFLDIAGKPPVKGRVSVKTAYFVAAILEYLFKLLPIKKEPPISRFLAVELATSHWFDISKAKKELGYVPKVSIEAGLKRLCEWHAGNGK